MWRPSKQSSELLNSWKEISSYVGRGVRTVQRWERDFGLPVRRPGGHIRGAVIALRSDIDQWLSTRAAREAVSSVRPKKTFDMAQNGGRLAGNLDAMKERYAKLIEENRRLRDNLARITSITNRLREEMQHRRGTLVSGATINAFDQVSVLKAFPAADSPAA
jgi:phage terminase Nu1 subunit (DNA packaging protein)